MPSIGCSPLFLELDIWAQIFTHFICLFYLFKGDNGPRGLPGKDGDKGDQVSLIPVSVYSFLGLAVSVKHETESINWFFLLRKIRPSSQICFTLIANSFLFSQHWNWNWKCLCFAVLFNFRENKECLDQLDREDYRDQW